MSYEQARDILDHAGQFHDRVSAYYQTLSNGAARQRVKLLLEYLSRRHAAIRDHLAASEESGTKDILDTWFQYSADSGLTDVLESDWFDADGEVDDVIALVLRVDERLTGVYRKILDTALSDHVREYFEMLLKLEQSEEQIMLRDALMMKDM